MICFPNIKINIGLNIVSKRKDRFHNIETIFYPVNFNDILEILKSDEFLFVNTGIQIDCPLEKNLSYRAWKLMHDKFDIGPVKIVLHKNVPYGSGLGGGSSDAAFTLVLLNKFFDLQLSENELIKLASTLGADCAFFIKNKPIYAYHKGDVFEEISLTLKDYYLLLCIPNVNINTAEAYKNCEPQKPEINLKSLVCNSDVHQWQEYIKNDFEKTIFKKHPRLQKVKETLLQNGAIFAQMSGSGSAIYGIFDRFPENLNIYENCLIKIIKLQ